MAAALATVPGSALAETPTGTLSGQILDERTGQPIAGACAFAWLESGGAQRQRTDSAGRFEFEVEAGPHPVSFADCDELGFPIEHSARYHPEYYDDHPGFVPGADAELVDVPAGGSVEVDAALAPTATISGRVTADETGEPLAGICVGARPAAGGIVPEATTDSDGRYRLLVDDPGSYFVSFWDCATGRYLGENYGFDSIESAHGQRQPLTVEYGRDLTGIDASLGSAVVVSGTVLDRDSGAPVPGACVLALRLDPSGSTAAVAHTDAQGRYSIFSLGGRLVVELGGAGDCSAGGYPGMFYDGVRDCTEATFFDVEEGDRVGGIDFRPSMAYRPADLWSCAYAVADPYASAPARQRARGDASLRVRLRTPIRGVVSLSGVVRAGRAKAMLAPRRIDLPAEATRWERIGAGGGESAAALMRRLRAGARGRARVKAILDPVQGRDRKLVLHVRLRR